MGLEPFEVRPGLALHLDAEFLLHCGATFTGHPLRRAVGPHYFICKGVRGSVTQWCAASSKPGNERVRVTKKRGARCWTGRDTYAIPEQVWTIEMSPLLLAAEEDFTRPGTRNYADLDWLLTEAA